MTPDQLSEYIIILTIPNLTVKRLHHLPVEALPAPVHLLPAVELVRAGPAVLLLLLLLGLVLLLLLLLGLVLQRTSAALGNK